MENNATTRKNGSPIDSKQINNTPKDKTMSQVVLEKLLAKSETGMNTHEAFDAFGSHCINSYVIILSNRHNLNVNRIKKSTFEKMGGQFLTRAILFLHNHK